MAAKTARKTAKATRQTKPEGSFLDWCFADIDPDERRVIDHVAKLYPDKIGIDLDFGALGIFARNFVLWRRASRQAHNAPFLVQPTKMTKEGEIVPIGEPYGNPIFTLVERFEKPMLATSARIGLTPADRKKIAIDMEEDTESRRGRKKQRKNMQQEEDDIEAEFA